VPFLEGADRFAFSAALGATLVRVGNFFNSEIVGRPTPDQSWGIRFPRYDRIPNGPYRYPSQFYEVALGLLVLLVLYIVDKKAGKEERPRGLLISVFFAVYFTGRFFVEYYKAYQTLPTSTALTMGQFLSIPAALLGYYGIAWSLKKRLPVGWAPPEDLEEEEELLDEEDEEFEDEDDEDDEGDEQDEEQEEPPPPRKKKKPAPEPADDEDDEDDESE
jgi:prolipoprotein diacylglyceryltransferase